MSRRLAIGVWVLSMAMIAVSLVLIGLVPTERAPAGARLTDVIPILPMPLSAATIGALISWQRPGNLIGRLLSIQGSVSALQYLAAGYAIFGSFSAYPLPQANLAGWIFSWSGAIVGLLACPIVFRFPDGRSTLRRARIGLACGVTSTVLLAMAIGIVLAGERWTIVGDFTVSPSFHRDCVDSGHSSRHYVRVHDRSHWNHHRSICPRLRRPGWLVSTEGPGIPRDMSLFVYRKARR